MARHLVAQRRGAVGDPGNLHRHRRLGLSSTLRLQGELRHPGPRVAVTLAGLAPHVGDNVDVDGLAAQVTGAGVLLGDVPERVE